MSGSHNLFRKYLSLNGAQRFRKELEHLRLVERPKIVEIVAWASGNGDRSENADYQYGRQKLREIDRRMRFLAKRIENAIIVRPEEQKRRDCVFFGARVTLVDENDVENSFTILGASIGDERVVKRPDGEKSVEIMDICYPLPEKS
ncbi:transcription elongation factor GreB [Acetobacteraceae bacterium]|nr:transcription elongation factor GreB [Acetobacteraceae bacterium]